MPRDYLEGLKASKDKSIFICGNLGNEEDVRDVFERVFALYVDDETLKYRLATRTGNDWGKQPHELEQTLMRHHEVYDGYRKRGDTIVDATKSVDEVADFIIRSSGA